MSLSDGSGLAERYKRRRWVVGTVALIAVLGPAAYLVTAKRDDHRSASARDSGATAVIAAGSASPTMSSARPASAGGSATPPSPSPGASPRAVPEASSGVSVDDRIRAARKAAADAGHPLQRALTPHVSVAGEGPIVERTETTAEGPVRVVFAKFDLTGQQEMLMVADRGKPAGEARCTHRVRFTGDAAAREIPNLLLCFRISATRSVVTLAVGKKVSPSAAISAAIIAREWAKLG